MAAWRHGRKASVVTEAAVFRYRLAKVDPELPDLFDRYVRAMGEELSAADLELAIGMTQKTMIRRWILEEIIERGVEVEEVLKDSNGKEVGRRIRANPLISAMIRLDRQRGITADEAGFSRRGRAQDSEERTVTAARCREARLQAAEPAGVST